MPDILRSPNTHTRTHKQKWKEEEQLVALPLIHPTNSTNQMPSKLKKKKKEKHKKDELIEVSISMATQNSFDDVPSQSAGRAWPNHGTDWCAVACY